MPGNPGDELIDDASIPNETRILRRVAPTQVKMAGDIVRPQSNAFSNSPDGRGTSIDIWDGDRQPEGTLAGHDGFGLVWLTVADVRAAGLGVIRNKIPGNPHHTLIQGKKTKGIQRQLATAAHWIKLPKQRD